MSARVAFLLFIAWTARAAAQVPTNLSAADSSNAAQAAWLRGVAASKAGDTSRARREVQHAAAAWPVQAGYLFAPAAMSAEAGDTAAMLAELAAYATLGVGRDLHDDAHFARYSALPAFKALVARLDSNRAPLVRSRMRATIADTSFWPEGMDFDPHTGRYYVASVRHGTIAEVVPGKPARELWPRDQPGIGAVLGVRVDTARHVLWATLAGIPQHAGFTPPDTAIAALVRVRIADGTIERRWDLPLIAGGHVLGDLVIGPHGDVFTTDSKEPVLYRLRPGRDSLERTTSPLFRNLQGMAPTADGRTLYVADYLIGLLRVDLQTGEVTRLADPPRFTTLGCDGIVLHHGAIIAVQNGLTPPRVMRYVLDATGRRIVRAEVLDRNLAVADEPTIGAIAGQDFVYVADGQWDKHDDDGVRKPQIPLTPAVLLAVPVP